MDEEIVKSAQTRWEAGRFPVWCWSNPDTRTWLFRASQPIGDMEECPIITVIRSTGRWGCGDFDDVDCRGETSAESVSRR